MGDKMIEGTYLSADGKTDVAYYIFDPKVKMMPRGIVQITHGMQDYILRYKELIEHLNNNGYIVCGNDDLGHGKTSKSAKTDGFFDYKNGNKKVLADIYTLTKIVKDKYGNIPYFLIGHSMGSFFARYYAYMYGEELSGLVLLGTSGKVIGTGFAIKLLSLLKTFKGKDKECAMLENIMLKKYYKYIDHVQTGKEWVTSDNEKLIEYENDPRCSFKFKIATYQDMLKTLKFVNSKKWARGIDKNLPIAIYSGSHDPVGDYGKGVSWVYGLLETQKVKNLQLKLYPKARHELHNETESIRQEFLNDIVIWLNKYAK